MINEASRLKPDNDSTDSSADYVRIAKTIAFLQLHFREQPSLETIARAAHLSPCHFQRLFTRWAGISPKRFLQFLTAEYAKGQLAESKAVLEAALNSGLSGPSRLHDLFVSVEGVTPGEYKTGGAGLQIAYGFHSTIFGLCLLGITQRGICWLSFVDGGGQSQAVREMKSRWNGAELVEQPNETTLVASRVFSDLQPPPTPAIRLLLMGTNFQIKVWRALLTIPPGAMLSYESLARLAGASKATRAVGTAIGLNPIACLIPCHRVIRKTGLLGGYRWGTERKLAMLGWEAAKKDAQPISNMLASRRIRWRHG